MIWLPIQELIISRNLSTNEIRVFEIALSVCSLTFYTCVFVFLLPDACSLSLAVKTLAKLTSVFGRAVVGCGLLLFYVVSQLCQTVSRFSVGIYCLLKKISLDGAALFAVLVFITLCIYFLWTAWTNTLLNSQSPLVWKFVPANGANLIPFTSGSYLLGKL